MIKVSSRASRTGPTPSATVATYPPVRPNPWFRLRRPGHITFSADGTTSGVLTASINGQISPITVHGSWTINLDGSVSETEIQTGGPGQTLHFKDYPTLDG